MGKGELSGRRGTHTLHLPYFGVGFKAYTWGEGALRLARVAEAIAAETGIPIYVTPQLVDIALIVRRVDVPVLAPCLDALMPGRGQGHVLAEAVRGASAVGAVINHSERRIPLAETCAAIRRAREVGLVSLVCADSPEEAKAVATLGPDAVIPEPPGLIGTLRSVTAHQRDFLVRSVEAVKAVDPGIAVICGGGVSSAEDVAEAVKQGADGVGAARAICEARDPRRLLSEMVNALKSEWKKRKR